jgi:alkylation response protein AidB-like acyl-CoA dehydrogenase
VRSADGGWVINGSKTFITNGVHGDIYVVAARTDPEAKGSRGISMFIVDKGNPGLKITRQFDKHGWRCSDTAELFFDDLKLPADALLGEEGKGFRTAMQVLDNGRIEVAAQCIGLAGAAMNAAIAYAKDRVIGGVALSERQGIRWMIADMGVAFRSALLLAQDAARQRDLAHQHGGRFSLAASMAKLAASEAAGRIADTALQLHGGYGYTRDFPIERINRDLRIMRIYEGSSEIQRTIISGNMLA